MAFVNISKPSGLSPVEYINGAKWDGKVRMYYIAPADTNAYWPGDLVTLANAGDPATGIAGITLATAGNVAVGVVQAIGVGNNQVGASGFGGGAGGPYINANNLAAVSRASGAQPIAYYAAVIDDPNVIFEIQEGGAGTNLTYSAIGNNANIVYAAPATGVVVSGTTLNNASVATTATLNLQILSLAQRIDNHFVTSPATGGGGQKWWVRINNHQFRAGTAGV
jgi:hypothetical protein